MSDTSRPPTLCLPPIWQGGREMSAPRPYETYPFNPLALFLPVTISIYVYIQNCPSYFLRMVFTLYICCLRMRSSTITYSKAERHFEVILSSMGYVLVRDTVRQCHQVLLAESSCKFTKGNGAKHTLIAPVKFSSEINSGSATLIKCIKHKRNVQITPQMLAKPF